jgi:3'(2'), 5'-bisphosphate nucleotidase
MATSLGFFPQHNVLERELCVALEAVRQASDICRQVQSTIDPAALQKQDRSPVTIADFASQACVCRSLLEALPDDPIIAEEDSRALRDPRNAGFLEQVCQAYASVVEVPSSGELCRWIDHGGSSKFTSRFWTLDPIDGTKGFLRGEQYAVSLALVIDGQVQLGVLGCPNLPAADAGGAQTGWLLAAVRGGGAMQWPLSDASAGPQPVRVTSTATPERARLCESVESGHSAQDQTQEIRRRLGMLSDPRRLDSQAKYAVVARGEADLYLRLPTRKDYREKIWDHAAGVIIVEEAGGRVSDIHGRPLDWTRGVELAANAGVTVTNGHLHRALLSAVREVLSSEATD